jgi:hypothetical protein
LSERIIWRDRLIPQIDDHDATQSEGSPYLRLAADGGVFFAAGI